jgi:hypothetical protein
MDVEPRISLIERFGYPSKTALLRQPMPRQTWLRRIFNTDYTDIWDYTDGFIAGDAPDGGPRWTAGDYP